MDVSKFRSLSEENIAQLLNYKDSENTKKLMKQHRLIFESHLKEKNIKNNTTAVELATVLRKFYAEVRKKMDTCTQKTPFVPSDFLCVGSSNKN